MAILPPLGKNLQNANSVEVLDHLLSLCVQVLHTFTWGQLRHIAKKQSSPINIHHILHSGHVSDRNFIVMRG